jgi:hypothetical protein
MLMILMIECMRCVFKSIPIHAAWENSNKKPIRKMKKLTIRQIRKYGVVLAAFFLTLLASEEILAQFINNQNARMDVRGTSRRTARRVDRRHDAWEGGSDAYYAPAPAAAAAGAAVGAAAVLYSLPGGCIDNGGIYDCNGTRYQSQMQGTQVVYVQVD